MLLTSLSGLSASSSTMILQPNAFACAIAPFWKYWRLSLAASGFWKPIVHFVPILVGAGNAFGSDASAPLYPGMALEAASDSDAPTPNTSAATTVAAPIDLDGL